MQPTSGGDSHDEIGDGVAQSAQPRHVDAREALLVAVQLHQQGYLDAAQELYERLLKLDPRNANALHYLGVLLHARGKSDEAIECMRQSIALDPGVPDWHANLGNVMLNLRRLQDAADAYAVAVGLAPDNAAILNNLGALRRVQQRFPEAEAALLKGLELDPARADVHANLGNLYGDMGLFKQAFKHYCEAVILDPKLYPARTMLGIAYQTLGRFDEAAKVYRDWMVEEPDNPLPRHYLAACTGEAVPDRAEDAYVEATFDAFADSFDGKLEQLAYRAPQIVADAVARIQGEPGKRMDILDAGCGTGLCGPLVALYARRLVGVDLSSRMLQKAAARNVYGELQKAELTAYLQSVTEEYDLVISADTLCYFGRLEAVLRAAHDALRAQGWLVFTLESIVDGESAEAFRLNPHGRYSHDRDYVEAVLRDAGFATVDAEYLTLRTEAGLPVHGWLITAQREGPLDTR
jgi:predicted TPR repeat methyltransferase